MNVVAIDESTRGHVNLDAIAQTGRPALAPPEPPVLGFADLHSHPMAHQSFGGLQGHRTYMGVPGADWASYWRGQPGVDRFKQDMLDVPTHTAGTLLLGTAFSLIHRVTPDSVAGLHEQMHITEIRRAWEGGLRLMSSLAVSNEALEHVTGEIVDRETGGPPCVDAGGLCERDGRVRATVPTTRDRQIIEAHVLGMRQLVAHNADWMEIVRDPDQAYDAMVAGKLAIVLGSEVDSLGGLGFASPEAEVDWLWGLGVRQVTPVHAIENPIGSPALFQDLYNTTNDLVTRPERDARRDRIADEVQANGTLLAPFNAQARFGALMRVENWGCRQPIRHVEVPPGECIQWRFDNTQMLFALDTNLASGPHPMFHTVGERYPLYSAHDAYGQRNRGGLTPLGLRYVRALMRRGMLVDVEHMSDHTIDALIASGTVPGEPRGPVWDALPAARPGCEPGTVYRPRSVRPGCYEPAYPLMSSHTSFRGQSMPPDRTAVKDYRSREFERTPRQIEFLRESGGVIAPVIGQDPIVRHPWTSRPSRGAPAVTPFRGEDHPLRTDVDRRPDLNDCAGSSKGWITAYLYGVQKMGGRGVALADDMAVVGSVGPRFNPPSGRPELPKNCPASKAAPFNPRFDLLDLGDPRGAVAREMALARAAEERLAPDQYNRRQDPRSRVRYYDPVRGGSAMPAGYLRRHRTPDGRVYDFNVEGVKTIGALPDLLQDAVNVGVSPEDLRPLLRSAQDYVAMWRKAYRVTRCDVGPRTTQAVYERCAGTGMTAIDERVCANTCPDSPGRGHALRPDGRPLFP